MGNEKQRIIEAKELNKYSTIKINADVIKKAIHSCFTDKEIETIEMVIDVSIYNLINHKMLQFGIVSLDVCKLDDFIELDYGESLSNYIINKYGEEALEVIKKAIKKRYIL